MGFRKSKIKLKIASMYGGPWCETERRVVCIHMHVYMCVCVHVHMCAYVCGYVLVFHMGRKLNLLCHELAPSTMVSIQSCHVLMTSSCSSGT